MSDHAGARATAPRMGYREALTALRSARKGRAAGAPGYSVYVNRPLGRFVAAGAHVLGLGPNAVTALSAALTFAGIALIATQQPSPWLGPLVWLLLALGYAFDSADGQVARLGGGGSLAGEWLDHVIDAAKISALHLAVLTAAWRWQDRPSELWLLVPIGFTVVASTTFFAMILNDQLKRSAGVVEAAAAGGGSWLRSVILLPTDYGILCLLFVFVGVPSIFFPLYLVFFVINAAFLVLALVRWFRVMLRVDRAVKANGVRA